MSRWEPNARARLLEAAMVLYRERGFDQTTVAEIAARAGLTERTFFRYFADKREVLFSGSERLEELLVERLAGAPVGKAPMDVVAAAVEGVGPLFEERRDFARQRQALIEAHADLRERELIKLASLASAMADALRRRGVPEPAAGLAAEAGIAVFKFGFVRWVHDGKRRDLSHHIRESLGELKSVTGGRPRTGARPSRSRTASATRPKRPTRRRV
jgi:AcrR family transcriptional regulator